MAKWEELPVEIQERMLQCQEEQGNKKDESVFIRKINEFKRDGGFNWGATKEKSSFWSDVIHDNKFEIFYEYYPKKEKPSSALLNLTAHVWSTLFKKDITEQQVQEALEWYTQLKEIENKINNLNKQ